MSFTRLEHADEAEWLAQRREYVTATEVGRLERSESEFTRLSTEKEHGSTFTGNRFTRWGNEREADIVAYIKAFGDTRLEPNDDLLVMDGTPYAATPDAISDDGEVIGEVKTTGTDFGESIPAHYIAQVQWQLMVTGADACVFGWEVRHADEYGDFYPGDPKCTVIVPDLNHQARLRELADRFLTGDFHEPTTPAELESLSIEVLDLQEQIKEMQAQVKQAKERIRDAVGDIPGTYPCDVANVIVTADTKSTGVDLKALREEHPDIVALYPKMSSVKGSVKVAAAKSEGATA